MKYDLKIYNSARHIVTRDETVSNRFRFAIVEVNVKDRSLYAEDSGFSTILDDAWSDLPSQTPSWEFPASLAETIESHLATQYEQGSRIYTVSYAGVALEDNRIFLSWAGLFRAHLSVGGEITRSTRDHNLVSDSHGDFQPSRDPRANAMDSYTPTRQLLAHRTASDSLWETEVWETDGDYELIFCSDFYHRFREPQRYVSHFSDLIKNNIEPEPVPGGGIISVISARKDVPNAQG